MGTLVLSEVLSEFSRIRIDGKSRDPGVPVESRQPVSPSDVAVELSSLAFLNSLARGRIQ